MSEQSEAIPTQSGWTVTKGNLVADFGTANQHAATEFLRLLESPQTKISYKGERL
jgi:hypothetical protein